MSARGELNTRKISKMKKLCVDEFFLVGHE